MRPTPNAARSRRAPGNDEDVEETSSDKTAGFALVFDVVRRFAQPLGIDLQKWEKRTIETQKGVVRLLPVAERARQLFGERGVPGHCSPAGAGGGGRNGRTAGRTLSRAPGAGAIAVRERRPTYGDDDGSSEDRTVASASATTLDRVHTGMLLQAAGQTNGLRALLKAERERGPDFLRLSNALSALYPRGSEEKRLLDGMLLAAPK